MPPKIIQTVVCGLVLIVYDQASPRQDVSIMASAIQYVVGATQYEDVSSLKLNQLAIAAVATRRRGAVAADGGHRRDASTAVIGACACFPRFGHHGAVQPILQNLIS